MDNYFESKKVYYSIQSAPAGYKATIALKEIKDGNTSNSEVNKTFPSIAEAMVWIGSQLDERK